MRTTGVDIQRAVLKMFPSRVNIPSAALDTVFLFFFLLPVFQVASFDGVVASS